MGWIFNPFTGKFQSNTPATHATSHTDGTDDIQSATASQKGLATATQITKLDGIETGATADQTGAEIKSLYEAEADTNAFTDSEKTKLAGVATGADVTADNAPQAHAVSHNSGGSDELNHDNLAGFDASEHFTEASINHANITAGDGSDHADVASNTAARHTQGTDTTLGIQAQDLNMGTHKVVGVVDPTADQEAATKKYVDDNVSDTAYGVGWNGDTGTAASKNAIYDEIERTKGGLDAFFRSQFAYHDADQITCEAAQYMCKDKYCYWISTITTNATGAAGGVDWWYLYLDYSAITSGTAITATELIWSTTEPAFNSTYRQWMNGDDRCIFAVRTNASSEILEFFHVDNFVLFANYITVTSGVDPDNVWTDSTQVIPKFTQKAQVTFRGVYVNATTSLYWRTNGQTGTAGHWLLQTNSTEIRPVTTLTAITDSDGILEFKYGSASGNTVYITTDGWYFSRGI